MYFSGTLEIDPSQMTVIKKVKPTKMFAKFLDALTLGASSDKMEHETFTAVSVLQQMNMAFRSMKIKNVVRLAVDNYDFYFDEKGEEDDMHKAMLEFETKVDPLESEHFNSIFLVLEHSDNNFKYLVEIQINKNHKVGEFPIKVVVNGVLTEFKLKENETREDLERRMASIFSDQKAYDAYTLVKKKEFENFIDELSSNIRKFIQVDDINTNANSQLVRPKEKVKSQNDIKWNRDAAPINYGYYGYNNYFFYSMMWSSCLYSNNIYVHDTSIMDESGNNIMDVGEEGFNAGDSNALNEDANFEAPTDGDVSYHSGSDYDSELQDSNVSYSDGTDSVVDDSSWMDSGDAGGDASSCSSCSSCGGCGGCS